MLRGILRYYNRSMGVARARVNATMGIPGVFWPETSTLFGTYDAAFLGAWRTSLPFARSCSVVLAGTPRMTAVAVSPEQLRLLMMINCLVVPAGVVQGTGAMATGRSTLVPTPSPPRT